MGVGTSSLGASLPMPFGGPPPARGVAAQAQRDALGVDILFTDNLQVTSAGDYAEVEGEENLRRAILRRLVVRPGEFRWRPKYGVGVASWLKKPLTTASLDELEHRIRDQLSQEKRITRILEFTIEATTFGTQPGIRIKLVVEALGRKVAFQPFTFVKEA